MSLTMNPFHLEVDPTVLVALLTMAAHAIQACLSQNLNTSAHLSAHE